MVVSEEKCRSEAWLQEHAILCGKDYGLSVQSSLLPKKKPEKKQGNDKVSGQTQNRVLHNLPRIFITKQSLSSRHQEEVFEQLRQDMASGKAVQAGRKYFVSLPTEEAHSGHHTGQCSGFSQWIHPLLIEQSTELGVYRYNKHWRGETITMSLHQKCTC